MLTTTGQESVFNTDFIAQRSKFLTGMVMIAARVSAQAPHFSWSISDSSLSDSQLVRRYRIVVSTPRCGRGNRSSNLRADIRLSFYPREGCACWPYATGKWWWSVRDPTGHEGCLGSINPPLLLKKVVDRAGASQKLVDSAAAPDHHLPSRILVRGARIRMQAGLALLPLRTKFAVFRSTLRL